MMTSPDVGIRIPIGRDEFEISCDATRLDRQAIHDFLSTKSYWARGVPFDVVNRSIDHSLNFGAYTNETGVVHQVGYARVISDSATFAFIRDVFVIESHRGMGIGASLVRAVLAHPDLGGLRRIMLATKDAHGLYERFGFVPLGRPDRFLAIEHSSKELYS